MPGYGTRLCRPCPPLRSGAMSSYELGHVSDHRPPFRYAATTRVWFSDTDAQGVVYYGRYMPYFDHARVEYHRHLGLSAGPDLDLAMRASTVEYVARSRSGPALS